MNTSQKIDRLGAVLAAKAELATEEKALKADLKLEIEAGTTGEGGMFNASHSQADRNNTKYQPATIWERLQASKLYTANVSSQEVDTIKVTSR